MPRRPANNPRQVRVQGCGCGLCLEKYPEPARKKRRDCIGAWQARYRDPAGNQKARNFPKKKDAEAFLDSVRTRVRARDYHDPKRGQITVSQWWEQWWPAQVKKGRTTTQNRKVSLWSAHIKPKWGDWRLCDLESLALQAWLSSEVKGHATQTKVIGLLTAMLKDAVRDGQRIIVNPVGGVEVTATPVNKHADDLRPPTPAEYQLIRQCLPAYYRPLVDFAEETGMRWGEFTGLRWAHLDRQAGTASVREIIVDDHGRLVRQGLPKTAAGVRTVPLTEKALSAVNKMADIWGENRTRSEILDGMHPEELVFRGPKSGLVTRDGVTFEGVMSRNNFRRVWVPAIQAAGVARMVTNPETKRREWWPRVHDYRHALATRLHEGGVSERDVQTVLGQERGGRVTWLYTHGSEGAVETVRSVLQPARRLRVAS